ncbi:hypothetical protein HDU98_006049, partial [Podochytrium sp. JEL0797]
MTTLDFLAAFDIPRFRTLFTHIRTQLGIPNFDPGTGGVDGGMEGGGDDGVMGGGGPEGGMGNDDDDNGGTGTNVTDDGPNNGGRDTGGNGGMGKPIDEGNGNRNP